MKKAIIFGAGSGGVEAFNILKNTYDIVAFTDNKFNNINMVDESFCGKPIISPNDLRSWQSSYDIIVIASESFDEIYHQLVYDLNIPPQNIKNDLFAFHTQARITALTNIAFEITRRNIKGEVAELGVYRGGFAKYINELFPDKVLHLFDTFEGFDERDVKKEKELFKSDSSSPPTPVDNLIQSGHLGNTSLELVMSKMTNPNKCCIHKGYFPETAKGIDETFCFVSIDVDLYQPALAGLHYFYPRLESGGILLLHDMYTSSFYAADKAFYQFLKEYDDIKYVPIGDGCSVAIAK